MDVILSNRLTVDRARIEEFISDVSKSCMCLFQKEIRSSLRNAACTSSSSINLKKNASLQDSGSFGTIVQLGGADKHLRPVSFVQTRRPVKIILTGLNIEISKASDFYKPMIKDLSPTYQSLSSGQGLDYPSSSPFCEHIYTADAWKGLSLKDCKTLLQIQRSYETCLLQLLEGQIIRLQGRLLEEWQHRQPSSQDDGSRVDIPFCHRFLFERGRLTRLMIEELKSPGSRCVDFEKDKALMRLLLLYLVTQECMVDLTVDDCERTAVDVRLLCRSMPGGCLYFANSAEVVTRPDYLRFDHIDPFLQEGKDVMIKPCYCANTARKIGDPFMQIKLSLESDRSWLTWDPQLQAFKGTVPRFSHFANLKDFGQTYRQKNFRTSSLIHTVVVEIKAVMVTAYPTSPVRLERTIRVRINLKTTSYDPFLSISVPQSRILKFNLLASKPIEQCARDLEGTILQNMDCTTTETYADAVRKLEPVFAETHDGADSESTEVPSTTHNTHLVQTRDVHRPHPERNLRPSVPGESSSLRSRDSFVSARSCTQDEISSGCATSTQYDEETQTSLTEHTKNIHKKKDYGRWADASVGIRKSRHRRRQRRRRRRQLRQRSRHQSITSGSVQRLGSSDILGLETPKQMENMPPMTFRNSFSPLFWPEANFDDDFHEKSSPVERRCRHKNSAADPVPTCFSEDQYKRDAVEDLPQAALGKAQESPEKRCSICLDGSVESLGQPTTEMLHLITPIPTRQTSAAGTSSSSLAGSSAPEGPDALVDGGDIDPVIESEQKILWQILVAEAAQDGARLPNLCALKRMQCYENMKEIASKAPNNRVASDGSVRFCESLFLDEDSASDFMPSDGGYSCEKEAFDACS